MRDLVRLLTLMFFYFCNACDQSGNNFCQIEQWAPWSSCNSACGEGVQERQKYICCDVYIYSSLQVCLSGCMISPSWWQANATDHKRCGNCSRGGTFDLTQNRCICPLGYGGSCCDDNSNDHYYSTNYYTNTNYFANNQTNYYNLSDYFDQSSNYNNYFANNQTNYYNHSDYFDQSSDYNNYFANNQTNYYNHSDYFDQSNNYNNYFANNKTNYYNHSDHFNRFKNYNNYFCNHTDYLKVYMVPYRKLTTRTTQLTTVIKPTTQSITKITAMQKGTGLSTCVGNPCQHGTCIPVVHHYICLCSPGYEGQHCKKDKDDCANAPCQNGTCHDKVDDFHCDCVFFFKGKMCNKLPSWAIAGIALSSLAVLLICCCCWKWIMGSCNRDEEQTKVQPMKEKIKPKPMERQPRNDKW